MIAGGLNLFLVDDNPSKEFYIMESVRIIFFAQGRIEGLLTGRSSPIARVPHVLVLDSVQCPELEIFLEIKFARCHQVIPLLEDQIAGPCHQLSDQTVGIFVFEPEPSA